MTLAVNNLSLQFGNKTIFSDVNFHLEQGQIACLLGHSGCGKTSILRCLLGFETPKTGRIVLNDRTLFDESIYIAAHKRNIGMVFQDYALFPHLTVAQNIAFGLTNINKADQRQRVSELLDLIEMTGFESRYPHELSGGQQQRVALARSLAPKPKFVLLDEPFSNLDSSLRQSLSLQIKDLLKAQGVGAILVTHDQNEAFAMADKVGVMADGQLCQWDSPYELYHNPKNRAVAGLIGEGVFIERGRQEFEELFGRCAKPDDQVVFVRPEAVVLSGADDGKNENGMAVAVRAKRFGDGLWVYELVSQNDTKLFAKSTQSWEIGASLNAYINHAVGLT